MRGLWHFLWWTAPWSRHVDRCIQTQKPRKAMGPRLGPRLLRPAFLVLAHLPLSLRSLSTRDRSVHESQEHIIATGKKAPWRNSFCKERKIQCLRGLSEGRLPGGESLPWMSGPWLLVVGREHLVLTGLPLGPAVHGQNPRCSAPNNKQEEQNSPQFKSVVLAPVNSLGCILSEYFSCL